MIMARRMPAAMLFLRSPGGISHHPDETVLPEDVAAALKVGEAFRHRSIIDTEFDCVITGTARAGMTDAVIPQVSGRAWLTGISQYGLDPTDPFPNGYRLGDTW